MTRRSAIFGCFALCWASAATANAQTSVETSAATPRTAASETTVDRERLEIEAPRSANDLLRASPGVFVVQHGGEGKGLQLFVRGVDAVHGSDFELTLEGIPLNEFSNVHGHGYIDIGFLLPEVVRELSVRRGVVGIDQGNFATAGSADVSLMRDADRSEVSYEIGTSNRHRLLLLSAESGVLAGEVLWDAGFGEGREARRATVNAIRPLYKGPNGGVDALVLVGTSAFELPGTVRLDDLEAGRMDFYDSYFVGHGESTRALTGLVARHRSTRWSTRVVPYIGIRSLSIEENVTGALESPRGDLRVQEESSVAGGVRLDVVNKRTLGGRGKVTASLHRTTLAQSEDKPDERRELRGFAQQAALGVGWNRLFGPVDVDLGVRGEAVQYGGPEASAAATVVAPRASVRVFAGPMTFSTAAGRGYRLPTLQSVSEAATEPVLASSAELGVRFAKERVDMGASGFLLRTDREAFYDHVAGTTLELDAARRLGVEFDAAWLPIDALRLGVDGTFVDARFVGNRAAVPNIPSFVGHIFAIIHPHRRLRVGVRAGLFAGRNLAYGARAADAGTIGLTANLDLDPFELQLAVDNPLAMQLREGEVNYASDWRSAGGSGGATHAVHTIAGPPATARLTLSYHFGT